MPDDDERSAPPGRPIRLEYAASAASAAGGVSAVVALVLLLAASRWSCRAAAIAAALLGLGAWLSQAATAYFLAHMPPSTNLGGTGELIVQMLASGGVELLVPPVLLWLFTRRRIAGALAGG